MCVYAWFRCSANPLASSQVCEKLDPNIRNPPVQHNRPTPTSWGLALKLLHCVSTLPGSNGRHLRKGGWGESAGGKFSFYHFFAHTRRAGYSHHLPSNHPENWTKRFVL